MGRPRGVTERLSDEGELSAPRCALRHRGRSVCGTHGARRFHVKPKAQSSARGPEGAEGRPTPQPGQGRAEPGADCLPVLSFLSSLARTAHRGLLCPAPSRVHPHPTLLLNFPGPQTAEQYSALSSLISGILQDPLAQAL